MRRPTPILPIVFLKLERFYGKQYLRDAAYRRGWEKLSSDIGLNARDLLDKAHEERCSSFNAVVSETRASRVKKNAARAQRTCDPDLASTSQKQTLTNRRLLANFSSFAEPITDRILLLAGISPVGAVPSNRTHVLIRLLRGKESEDYQKNYREGKKALAEQLPANFYARRRAYLLIKRHGQEICKRTNPKCNVCPVKMNCVFFAETQREAPPN